MTVTLTYSVQVCNESRELYSLLEFLIHTKDVDDIINVVVDSGHTTDKVKMVTDNFKNYINVFERPFDTFPQNAKFHVEKCETDYIFQIDADEMPQEALMTNIKQMLIDSKAEIVYIPRINLHPGLTSKHLEEFKFSVNNVGMINWPDYQGRILKKCESVTWSDEMHSKPIGSDKVVQLQPDTRIALWHIKSMQKQASRWVPDESGEYIITPPSKNNLYDLLM